GESRVEGVGVLAIARHRRRGFVVLVRLIRRGHPKGYGWRGYQDILVIPLWMNPLARGRKHEVAIEAVEASSLADRHLDRIGERREVARDNDLLRVCRVRDRGEP